MKHISWLRIVALVCLCFSLTDLSGQTSDLSEVRRSIDHIFSRVNKEDISTGILRDYAIEGIPLEQYDGCLRDSNYSDFSAQILMLTSLFSGAVDERDTEVVALDSFMEK